MKFRRPAALRMVILILVISLLSTSVVYAETNADLENFVTRLYRLSLDREPDSGGLDYWVNELQLGKKTGADVSLNFIFSNEFINKNLDITSFLNIMYRSFFDRDPDPNGAQFWTNKINSGYSRKYVLANFVNSKEFTNICLTYGITPGIVKLSENDKNPNLPTKLMQPSEIVKAFEQSVVYIETFDSSGNMLGSGSGFIIDSSGKIVTNYHVIENSTKVVVYLGNGSSYNVTYVSSYDIGRDVAIIKINASGLSKVKLGNSDIVSTGERVVAIGSPFGLSNTVSEGLISNNNRFIGDYYHIQTSTAISPGSSGGPLINQYGEVIGVITWGVTSGQNLNFAIPINDVKKYISMDLNLSLASLSEANTVGVPQNAWASPFSDTQILIGWDMVQGADFYYVYSSQNLFGPYDPFTDSMGYKSRWQWDTEYCIEHYNLPSNTTVYYKVTAVKGDIESDFSEIFYATTYVYNLSQYRASLATEARYAKEMLEFYIKQTNRELADIISRGLGRSSMYETAKQKLTTYTERLAFIESILNNIYIYTYDQLVEIDPVIKAYRKSL